VKVDARSERWREHRKKVRGEIVDAAFRAIDRLGPDLSVREIAEEAGTAKPKIYGISTTNRTCFQAIGERLRDMLWTAIFPSIDLKTDSAREVIRRSVEEYVALVDKHPNVLRVFIQAAPGLPRTSLNEGARSPWPWPTCSTTSCGRWSWTTRPSTRRTRRLRIGRPRPTEWWLGPEPDDPRRMSSEAVRRALTTIMMESLSGTAEALGITMDPDRPIHSVVPSNPAVS